MSSDTALLGGNDENRQDGPNGHESLAGKPKPATVPFWGFAVGFQVIMICLFWKFASYADKLDLEMYGAYQHTHTMIFVGFGFLYTFMREYSFSGLGFNLLVACQCIQWATLTNWFFGTVLKSAAWGTVELDNEKLIEGDYAAGAALIAMGVLLGKTSALQLSVMSAAMMPFYSINQVICEHFLETTDAGGSMFIHSFGAAFGLACAYAHKGKLAKYIGHAGFSSTRTTDTFALVGSAFLFMYWPSFNCALLSGEERQRAIVNTVLSLSAAAMSAMATSSSLRSDALADGRFKLNPWDLANGILGGGVAIGSTCNMVVGPGGALLIGALSGSLTVIGFTFVQPCLEKTLGIHDTCGVQALHGMSGVFGALSSVVVAATATAAAYGGKEGLVGVFPTREEAGPKAAALAQFLGLAVTLSTACVGGLITGCIMQFGVFDGPKEKMDLCTDKYDWVEEEEEKEELLTVEV